MPGDLLYPFHLFHCHLCDHHNRPQRIDIIIIIIIAFSCAAQAHLEKRLPSRLLRREEFVAVGREEEGQVVGEMGTEVKIVRWQWKEYESP